MIISQQHARALRGAGVGDRGSGGHGAIYRRFWKSPILSKLTGTPRARCPHPLSAKYCASKAVMNVWIACLRFGGDFLLQR